MKKGDDLNRLVPPTFLLEGGESGSTRGEGEWLRFRKYANDAKIDEKNCFGLEFPDHSELCDHIVAAKDDEDRNENENENENESESENEEGKEEDLSAVAAAAAARNARKAEGNDAVPVIINPAEANSKHEKSISKNCDVGSLWIVKPAASTNRGYGIQVCQGYDQLVEAVTKPSKSKLNNRYVLAQHRVL